MKIVAAVLLLACAVSGQWLGYGGYPYAPYAYNSLPVAYKSTPYAFNTFTPYTYAAPAPVAPVAPVAPIAPVAPLVSSTQYHAQDELGQASFGYAHPGQAAANYRDAFGNQVGSYAYINPDGKEVKVSYVADSLGFRVLSNDLPVAPVFDGVAPVFDGVAPVFDGVAPSPVEDTPEVVEARAAHMAAIEAAKSGVIAVPEPVVVAEADLPKPVEDTPEVVAAKAEHAAAHAAAKAAADAAPERKRRQVFVAPTLGYGLGYRATLPLAYSAPVVAAPAVATREATLTNIVNTPGHAVSYRVD